VNKLIVVKEVLQSRKQISRPAAWEEREPGLEVVVDSEGHKYELRSTGQQSTPHVGWQLVLHSTEASSLPNGGWDWTLYGVNL